MNPNSDTHVPLAPLLREVKSKGYMGDAMIMIGTSELPPPLWDPDAMLKHGILDAPRHAALWAMLE